MAAPDKQSSRIRSNYRFFFSANPSPPSFEENEIGDNFFNVTFTPSAFDDEVSPAQLFSLVIGNHLHQHLPGTTSCWEHILR